MTRYWIEHWHAEDSYLSRLWQAIGRRVARPVGPDEAPLDVPPHTIADRRYSAPYAYH